MAGPAAKREAVAHLQVVMGLLKRWPILLSVPIARWCATSHAARGRRICPANCATSQTSGDALAIVTCSFSATGRRAVWHKPHLSALPEGGADSAQAPGTATRVRNAGAIPGQGETECTLAAGLFALSVRLRAALLAAQHRR